MFEDLDAALAEFCGEAFENEVWVAFRDCAARGIGYVCAQDDVVCIYTPLSAPSHDIYVYMEKKTLELEGGETYEGKSWRWGRAENAILSGPSACLCARVKGPCR